MPLLTPFQYNQTQIDSLKAELCKLFKSRDKSNEGKLDEHIIMAILQTVNPKCSDEVIKSQIRTMEKDGDGKIRLEDFIDCCVPIAACEK
ncbi:hypothetical protein HK098_004167 [Nowakowskiella sp. JEL0407]|nr:hypothetical protein HK098_004167 [Nowakowskiella sp. JEL0407]